MAKIQLLTGGIFPPTIPVTGGTEKEIASNTGSVGDVLTSLVGDGAKTTWVIKHQLNTTNILGILRANASYKEEIKAEAPVSYWRMDSATEMKDQAPAKNEGILHGAIGVAGGALTKGGDADQANSFVNNAANFWEIGEVSTGIEFVSNLTVECWIFPEQLNGGIFEKTVGGVENTSYKMVMEGSNGKITGHLVKAGLKSWSSTASLTQNAWNHCAMTYDNVTGRLYVNGVESGSLAIAGPTTSGVGACFIGKVQAGNPFKGRLDELALYPEALSATRILRHYNLGTKGEPTTNVPLDATHKIVALNAKEVEVTWTTLAAGEIGWVNLFG